MSPDELWAISSLSLLVSGGAALFATLLGIPLGAFLAFGRFRGRLAFWAAVNTLTGLPPVVAGLGVMMLLWRSGPLAALAWLYTPQGILLAQCVIALPIVTALAAGAFRQVPRPVRRQVWVLAPSRLGALWLFCREARVGLLIAVVTALGRVLSEVAAALLVGGDIKGETRVLTTAIANEARQGNFSEALSLAAILLLIAFALSGFLTVLQQRRGAP